MNIVIVVVFVNACTKLNICKFLIKATAIPNAPSTDLADKMSIQVCDQVGQPGVHEQLVFVLNNPSLELLARAG